MEPDIRTSSTGADRRSLHSSWKKPEKERGAHKKWRCWTVSGVRPVISSTRLSSFQYLNETVNKGTIDIKMPTPERLLPIGHPRNLYDIELFDRRGRSFIY
uniref:Uncharacterized protein n=1 Tax=Trichogramma kaykai TaxID=54128 RepID=A0ABD2W2G8_9HYME